MHHILYTRRVIILSPVKGSGNYKLHRYSIVLFFPPPLPGLLRAMGQIAP